MDVEYIIERWSVLNAEDLLRDIFQQFGIKAAIGTSFQKTGLVTIDIASKVSDNFRVFTIDTERLFPETYQYITQIEELYSDKLHNNKIELFIKTYQIIVNGKMVKEPRYRSYLTFE